MIAGTVGSPQFPMTRPDDLQRMYDRRFGPEARRAKAEVWKVIVEDFLQRWVAPTDRVLDVGCGMGEFLNHVRCAKRTGIDLNPAMKASLAPEIEFHAGDVRDLSFLADGSQDVVFTSNLLEHLPSKADVEKLVVSKVYVDGGPVSKKWMPRSMGRANRILSRTSHVTVEVEIAE